MSLQIGWHVEKKDTEVLWYRVYNKVYNTEYKSLHQWQWQNFCLWVHQPGKFTSIMTCVWFQKLSLSPHNATPVEFNSVSVPRPLEFQDPCHRGLCLHCLTEPPDITQAPGCKPQTGVIKFSQHNQQYLHLLEFLPVLQGRLASEGFSTFCALESTYLMWGCLFILKLCICGCFPVLACTCHCSVCACMHW